MQFRNSETFLTELGRVLSPFAAEADVTQYLPAVPRLHFQQLAQVGFYRAVLPQAAGGYGLPWSSVWEALEMLASACGATQFVNSQLVAAHSLLALGMVRGNVSLRPRLEAFLNGEQLCASAIGHLRRPGPASIVAVPEGRGYRVNGKVPWFSGWGIADAFTLGAHTPEGVLVYLLISLDRPELKFSQPLVLNVMGASSTVSIEVEDLYVEASEVVMLEAPDEMMRAHLQTILYHSAQSLGAARAAARILQAFGCEGEAAMILDYVRELRREAIDCPFDEETILSVRSRCSELGLRSAQAAVVASGGNAMTPYHPAGRVLREAAFYHLTQTTAQLRSAQLRQLLSTLPRLTSVA